MKAGVLYSGGKDSSLAAVMLGTYYEVELNTFVFDRARLIPSIEHGTNIHMSRRITSTCLRAGSGSSSVQLFVNLSYKAT